MNCNQITFIWNKPLCVFCELFALFYVLVRILWLTIWENEKGLWNVMGNFAIRIKTPIVRKLVVYTGDFENTAGDIEVVNYKNMLF